MKLDGKPESRSRKLTSHDLGDLRDLLTTSGLGKGDPDTVGTPVSSPDTSPKPPEPYEMYTEKLALFKKNLAGIKEEIANPALEDSDQMALARKALIRIHKTQKDCQYQKLWILADAIEGEASKIKKAELKKRVADIDEEMKNLQKENNFFVAIGGEKAEKHFFELNRQEIIESYFFEKGVPQVIIHGAEEARVNQETGEEDMYLNAKIDLDVWSALKFMELGGVKFAKGAKTSWINPKWELKRDEDGKPYYETQEQHISKDSKGEIKRDSAGKQKLKTKPARLYLKPGTVILDVGNTFGVNIVDGDVIHIDHHGEINKRVTSTTNELLGILRKSPTFLSNFEKNTGDKDMEWIENYTKFVTKVDNLDYIVNPETWPRYNNTLYAGQKYFNSHNREVVLDLFQNHPDIHFENFTREELNYVIATGDKGYVNGKISLKNLAPLRIEGEPVDPEYFIDHPLALYDKNLITLGDLVELQKKTVTLSNKMIEDNETVMHQNNFSTLSPVLGKTIIDEIDAKRGRRNPLGAVSAYGNGYDTYVILNLNGKQKNEIFVSTKEDANEFADNMRELFKKELGDRYTDELVIVVRDSMVVVRDKVLKDMDTDGIRAIIARALQIDGRTPENRRKDILQMVQNSQERTQEVLDSIDELLKNYNL